MKVLDKINTVNRKNYIVHSTQLKQISNLMITVISTLMPLCTSKLQLQQACLKFLFCQTNLNILKNRIF